MGSFQKVVELLYREKRALAEFAEVDIFTAKSIEVKNAFDHHSGVRKGNGCLRCRHGIGKGVLLLRRLVEAGCWFVTTRGYEGLVPSWETRAENNKNLRDHLLPSLEVGPIRATQGPKTKGTPRVNYSHRHG